MTLLNFSDELTIARMASSLRKVENLGTSARLIAYAKANVSADDIRKYDDRAWRVEELRRKAYAKSSPVKTAWEAAALVIFIATIALITPKAYAADEPAPVAYGLMDWLVLCVATLGAIGLVYLTITLLFPKRPARVIIYHDDSDDAHGDLGAWRGL